MEDGLDQRLSDVHISYLPLAHIYERVVLYTCLHSGSAARLPRALCICRIPDIRLRSDRLLPR
jgi:hypothetical protein